MGAKDSLNPILQLAWRVAGARKATRFTVHAIAKILINGEVIEGEVENISTNGVCVRSDKQIRVNSSVMISIFDELSKSRTILGVKAKVVWAMGGIIGLHFI